MPGVEFGCACSHDGSPTKKRLAWLGLFLVLVVGVVAGITVSATSKNKRRSAASTTVVYTPPETSNGGADTGSSNSGNNSGTDNTFPSDNEVFKFFYNVLEFYVYQTGANYFPTPVASANTVSLDACLDFCAAYSMAYYSPSTSQGEKTCECFDDIECMVPWGSAVNANQWINQGTIRTKHSVDTCGFDFCQAYPDHWVCLTGNTYDLQDVAVPLSESIRSSDEVSSDGECIEFCAEHDVARYAINVIGDACVCYDNVDCLAPWGDQVDVEWVAQGTLYSKKTLQQCSDDMCKFFPNDELCLTGNTYNHKSLTVSGVVSKSTNDVSSEDECLEFCSEYSALRYATNLEKGDACVCYDTADCLTTFGDLVDPDWVATGKIYSKQPLETCSLEYCDANPNNFLCLTGNHYDLEDGWIDQEPSQSTDSVSSLYDCLKFCASFEVAEYMTVARDDRARCRCHNSVECRMPIDSVFLFAPGSVHVKQTYPLCDYAYCDAYPDSFYCL